MFDASYLYIVHWSKVHVILFCLIVGSGCLSGQTFQCDGDLILSYNQGAGQNNLTRVTFGAFGTVFFSPFKTHLGSHYDALGYNPMDNFIYGTEVNTNYLVRLKSDGSSERIGSFDEVDIFKSSSGDCTVDGQYLCYDNELDELFIFDVINEFRLSTRVKLFWSGTTDLFTARLDDIAIDPNQPNIAYSFQGNYFDPDLDPFDRRGYFLSINIDPDDPNFGAVTPIARAGDDVIRQIGSLFFGADGQLWGYGATTQGPNIRQGTLVSINPRSGQIARKAQTGPTAVITDGCSCPYSLTFENNADPRGLLCSDVETTYTLSFNNRFFQEINGATLADTFPEGMIIESVSGKYEGNIMSGSGVGTRFLNIEDLVIPSRSVLSIDIKVRVVDLGLEFNGNQAHLTNLPERYGGSMISDDPQTVDFVGDVTDIWIVATDLEEFTIDIDQPSECLNADDSKVYITSPTLVSGLRYEVKIEDQEFNHTVRDIIVDENRGFHLDSLLPGQYELYEINTATSECSFALNDTTINIVAPNEQLEASAVSNGPLCESQQLKLSAEASPISSFSWKGPSNFRSEEQSPIIPSVILVDSGMYEMTATYGYCEQIRILDIAISEDIEAIIEGKDTYCERDEIRLKAEGKGEIKFFDWFAPDEKNNARNQIDEELNITLAELTDKGNYQVVLDNGICTDTANIWVDIMDAPSVTLPTLLETEFCKPLILIPDLSYDDEVTYAWSPSESLSCDDCPNPEVFFPIQPNYELTVTSVNTCSDSTSVNVSLNKEKLLYVPNVFSPNVASANHDFKMTPGCGLNKINKMSIYNRRGHPVYTHGPFDPEDKSAYWDGLINGSIGEAGVYVWYAELELADGQIVDMYGDVTLIP